MDCNTRHEQSDILFAKPVLYMAGDANGWDQIDYLSGEDGVNYTGFMYLNQNGFKFCSQQTGMVLTMVVHSSVRKVTTSSWTKQKVTIR